MAREVRTRLIDDLYGSEATSTVRFGYEGNEYEVYFWVAKELASAGMVHFREDDVLDATKLFKVQWREGVQIPGQISELPEDFYPKLRRYLIALKQEATQPEKITEYHKTQQ